MTVLPTARLVRDREHHEHAHGEAPARVVPLGARDLPRGYAAHFVCDEVVNTCAFMTLYVWFHLFMFKNVTALLIWAAIVTLLGTRMVRRRARLLRLVRFGRETRGRFIVEHEPKFFLDGVTPTKLVFEYEDENGRTWRTTASTTDPEKLRDEPTEAMLYDPKRPQVAVMLDTLKFRPFADDGTVIGQATSPVAWIAVPALTTAITLLVGIGALVAIYT